ncbi:MAG: large subunit ribosomal protein L1 [bacterium]|nr:MAG: large subunit ribosomal protein L1 [bacterium]RJP58975.1 MAG: 50S ribosomal protein L1 [Deltaproteobacteria bacterium]
MAKKGKKYLEAVKKVDTTKKYELEEGIKIVKDSSYAKFDESIDVSIKLGIDPRKPDQMVRGTVVLPSGTGKEVTILVFAKGEKEKEANEAGADFVGSEDLIDKIAGGWLGFDKVVATPDMMSLVGKIGKILGPRGLMPNPKVGTVTFDVARVVKELRAGKVDFRADKTGIVHVPVGRVSFSLEKILDNIISLLDVIIKAKPPSSKGVYLRSVVLASTMGPGIKIDPLHVRGRLK